MGRVSGPAPSAASEPDTIPADTRSTWRREQDRALKQRLEQLQIAQGRSQAPRPALAVSSAPTTTQTPPAAPIFPSHAPGRSYGIGAFLSVALLGALAGAGLMWITMNAAAPDTAAMPAIAAAAAVAPAPLPAVGEAKPMPAVQVDNGEAQARDLIEGWRQAWARRDASAYLTHYNQGFVPANGQTRASWAEGRQRNFAGKSSIQVTIGGLRIERLSADRIKAFFLQDYTAGNYRENAKPKTLLLQRAGQEWKIAGEWEGDYAITPQATQ